MNAVLCPGCSKFEIDGASVEKEGATQVDLKKNLLHLGDGYVGEKSGCCAVMIGPKKNVLLKCCHRDGPTDQNGVKSTAITSTSGEECGVVSVRLTGDSLLSVDRNTWNRVQLRRQYELGIRKVC